MFKEAGLRSPRTQQTKVQIEISVRGRRTEAIALHATKCAWNADGMDNKDSTQRSNMLNKMYLRNTMPPVAIKIE